VINRKALLISLLVALSGACAGCATKVPELKPVGKATVSVTGDERTTRATVRAANEVVILLPAPKPPGHIWQIAQHNSNSLKQLTEVTPAAGPAGESSVSFMALRAGVRTTVLFALVPPNRAGEVEPADVREIQLVIE
jgi:hypothetical protein